jgi:hypothetical protein
VAQPEEHESNKQLNKLDLCVRETNRATEGRDDLHIDELFCFPSLEPKTPQEMKELDVFLRSFQ